MASPDTLGFLLGDDGGCNPHDSVAPIPAAPLQLVGFLTPDGVVTSTCNGICDAGERLERPNGEAERCDPTPRSRLQSSFHSRPGFVRP